jgi:hypothetical protein
MSPIPYPFSRKFHTRREISGTAHKCAPSACLTQCSRDSNASGQIGAASNLKIIQLFDDINFDLNVTITMAGVEYFRPGFGMEKTASVTASRRRGSPFSCHGENIARGHANTVYVDEQIEISIIEIIKDIPVRNGRCAPRE